MSTFNIVKRIDVKELHANIDSLYGPYSSVDDANRALPIARRVVGMTVGVISNNIINEYWYKGGVSDADLVIKNSDPIEINNVIDTANDTISEANNAIQNVNDLIDKLNKESIGISVTISNNPQIIDHGLNKYPSVTVIDSEGNNVVCKVSYVSLDVVSVSWNGPISGHIYIV